jgi:hypothetical protein
MANFYLDHNAARRVAVLLRVDGFSAATARELGNERNDDVSQLVVAASRHCILNPHDDDFRRIQRDWPDRPVSLRPFKTHFGILLMPACPIWNTERTVSETEAFLEQKPVFPGALYEWTKGGWARW